MSAPPTLLVLEIIAVVVSGILFLSSLMLLGIAAEDVFYANTESSKYLAKMILRQWLLRAAGKFCFLGVMILALLANNSHILHWLYHWPYTTLILAILGLGALSVEEIIELIWRHTFLRRFVSKAERTHTL